MYPANRAIASRGERLLPDAACRRLPGVPLLPITEHPAVSLAHARSAADRPLAAPRRRRAPWSI